MMLVRSWMFVPGHRQRMIDKSFGVPVDAVMLDLEDGVAPVEKDTARTLIAGAWTRSPGDLPRTGDRTASRPATSAPTLWTRADAHAPDRRWSATV